jgi:hypothetical protein
MNFPKLRSKKFQIVCEKSHSSRAFQQYHAMNFFWQIFAILLFKEVPSNMVKETWRFVLPKPLPACDPFSDFFEIVLIVLKLKFAPIVCVEFCITKELVIKRS